MKRQPYSERERVRKRLKAIGAPCHICGKPIDYDLSWMIDPKDGKRKRHPWSFEYDHDKPFAECVKDGDVYSIHSFENAKPAHRICNQRKGNRNTADCASHEVITVEDISQQQEDTSRQW